MDSKGFRWGDGARSKWVAQHSTEHGCLAGEGQALLKDKSSYLWPCQHKPTR